MRLLYVADGRSPIALNWIRYFVEQGHEVHLVSTFPCRPELPLASLHIISAALSAAKARGSSGSAGERRGIWSGKLAGLRTRVRQLIGPLTLPQAARRLKEIAAAIRPDLVHAMRIPYEGMVAAEAHLDVPLLISVWGNDFTLHAPATPLMAAATRRALQQASALQADCRRDIRLAHAWGLDPSRPVLVCPGNGGIRSEIFHPGPAERDPDLFQVINPRGFRAYVRSDTFFQAAALVLKEDPAVRFVCPAMASEPQAQRWVQELGLSGRVELLPAQRPEQMAALFRRSAVMVSPSTHDGTPNTLLEAMACGAFPVVGDLEPLREWLTPGINGLLVDPASPQELASAVLTARSNPELLRHAAEINQHRVAECASYPVVMEKVSSFYRSLVK